jgi:pimeloyl-ACP methyl ester carboxylesterase
MGGGIVQTFALTYPQRLRALGLVSTSSEHTPPTRERFLWRAEEAERSGSVAELVDSMVERWFTPEFMRQHPEEVERTRATVAANDPRGFAGACRANAERNWTDQLPRITCPVLYVGGEEDPAEVRENARRYGDLLPDAEVHVLPGVSHLLPVEAPDRFNAILVAFLERVYGAIDGQPRRLDDRW